MGRKKILERRLARLQAKKTKLTERALASNDAAEVRSINEDLTELNEEITETQEEIAAIDEDAAGAGPEPVPNGEGEQRGLVPGQMPVNSNTVL